MQGWIADTKKIYDSTTYNAFIGTAASAVGSHKEFHYLELQPQAKKRTDWKQKQLQKI